MTDTEIFESVIAHWNGTVEERLPGTNGLFAAISLPGEQTAVLRLTDIRRRDETQVLAELDWLQHLRSFDLKVCYPIRSEEGEWHKRLRFQDGDFLAVVFKGAGGNSVRFNNYQPGFVAKWGATLARLHQAAIEYKRGDNKRPEWNPELLIEHAKKVVGDRDHKVLNTLQTAFQRFGDLERDSQHYGLIHSDLTPGNFRVDKAGELEIFDFDDCQIGYFIYDLVVILYMTLYHDSLGQRIPISEFLEDFLAGYCSIRPVDKEQWEQLPAFLEFFNGLVYISLLDRGKIKSDDPLFAFAEQGLRLGSAFHQQFDRLVVAMNNINL